MSGEGPPGSPFWVRVAPLGTLRCRILACLGADNPRLPGHFDPPANQPIEDAFRSHLMRLDALFASEPEAHRIVAAGLLTCGELSAAEEILQHLPPAPVRTDHGAGWCALIAYTAAAALLPVPRELSDPRQWVEGTAEGDAVRDWFHTHRDRLDWDPSARRFVPR